MPWQYSTSVNRYRDSTTGRFLSREQVLSLVQDSINHSQDSTTTLSSYVNPESPLLSTADWREAMRREIKDEYLRQYILGKGGRDQMTPADWGSVGGMLRQQYIHLDNFATDIADGKLTEGQIRVRSQMYIESARQGYEKGNTRAMGIPEMPAYPGDGSTVCLTNCRCSWRHEAVYDSEGEIIGYNSYWDLGAAEHCPDCVDRAGTWNPLETMA